MYYFCKYCTLEAKTTSTSTRQELLLKKEDCIVDRKNKNHVLYKQMYRAFISADIPWNKLQNVELKTFLEKAVSVSMSDESNQKSYLEDCCEWN